METDPALIVTLVLGLLLGGAVGQYLTRIGLWAPVLISALGFAVLALMLFLIGLGMPGPAEEVGHLIWAGAIMAGPVAGLLLGMAVGRWRRSPGQGPGQGSGGSE